MGDTLTVLSDDKIFVLSKLKAFADKNFIVAQMNQFFSNRVEDITEKGENAGYQHFFSHSFQWSPKIGICDKMLNLLFEDGSVI